MASYERMAKLYTEEEHLPWDDGLPPPEVRETAQTLPPGRALDLGCGYGRASIYLAGRGWEVDGVDFIPQAVAEATRRAASARVAGRARFYLSPVTNMAFLSGPYDLALDVGCMHDLAEEDRAAYASEVWRLVRPGGLYMLFAHLRGPEIERDEDGHPRWITDDIVLALFGLRFVLQRAEHGTTQINGQPPWNSGWYWFRRK